MKNFDPEFEAITNKIVKGKEKPVPKKAEPQTAKEWLEKAFVEADPADGAPKVGNIGYV